MESQDLDSAVRECRREQRSLQESFSEERRRVHEVTKQLVAQVQNLEQRDKKVHRQLSNVSKRIHAVQSPPTIASSIRYVSPAPMAPMKMVVEEVVKEPPVKYITGGWEPRVAGLEAQVADLKMQLAMEMQARQRADQDIVYLKEQLEGIQAHLSEVDFFASNDLEKQLRIVEDRGNIQVNFQTGHVMLLRPLTFAPRTTKDEPTAVFTRPELANAICQDLAEVLKLFKCPVEVEGHTKGGESEFWQTLADERARVVVEMMVKYGADRDKITPKGRPGKLGSNETKTVVHLNLPTDQLR